MHKVMTANFFRNSLTVSVGDMVFIHNNTLLKSVVVNFQFRQGFFLLFLLALNEIPIIINIIILLFYYPLLLSLLCVVVMWVGMMECGRKNSNKQRRRKKGQIFSPPTVPGTGFIPVPNLVFTWSVYYHITTVFNTLVY